VKLSDLGEDRLIERLTAGLPTGSEVVVGIGDDCAALRQPGSKELLLLKTDCLIEDIHFLRSARPAEVGWKALCRVLSDIAAMGGRPGHALVTAAFPKDLDVRYAEGIYRGLRKAAERYGSLIIGGETSASTSGIFLSIAMTGSVLPTRIKRRDTGRAGDSLYVTGKLGGSIRGRHLRFEPRVEQAGWLARRAAVTAMMDLSDGLGSDLPRLAKASGLGYEVEPLSLPLHRGCTTENAWSDGEDYELLLAVSPKRERALTAAWKRNYPKLALTRIGELTPAATPGEAQGFDHFLADR